MKKFNVSVKEIKSKEIGLCTRFDISHKHEYLISRIFALMCNEMPMSVCHLYPSCKGCPADYVKGNDYET